MSSEALKRLRAADPARGAMTVPSIDLVLRRIDQERAVEARAAASHATRGAWLLVAATIAVSLMIGGGAVLLLGDHPTPHRAAAPHAHQAVRADHHVAPASVIPISRRTTLRAVLPMLRCPSCHAPLAHSHTPQAQAERTYIKHLIQFGQTRREILKTLRDQYGPSVLSPAGRRLLGPPVLSIGDDFRAQGVTLGPPLPSGQAQSQANAAGLPTPHSAIQAARRDPANPFGNAFDHAKAILVTVNERNPITRGVTARKAYEAWAIGAHSHADDIGGVRSGPIHATCLDVLIYDLHVRRWSEALQTC